MKNIVVISNTHLMPDIIELLNNNKKIKITVTGMSMYPFLRHGIDHVELKKKEFSDIKVMDIVLYQRESGEYILHRLKKKENGCFYAIGDAQNEIEGPILEDQIIGVTVAIWRSNFYISADNLVYKQLSVLWMRMRYIRMPIIKCKRLFDKLAKKISYTVK